MKLKNVLQLFVLFIVTLAAVSCGSDDEEETVDDLLGGNDLVGTWLYVEGDGYTETAVFNSDGTGSYTAQFPGEAPDTSNFTYTVSGNTIDITFEDQENDDPTVNYSISGNELTLTFTFPEGDVTTVTYTRVS